MPASEPPCSRGRLGPSIDGAVAGLTLPFLFGARLGALSTLTRLLLFPAVGQHFFRSIRS
jgi:hypothetical protein